MFKIIPLALDSNSKFDCDPTKHSQVSCMDMDSFLYSVPSLFMWYREQTACRVFFPPNTRQLTVRLNLLSRKEPLLSENYWLYLQ